MLSSNLAIPTPGYDTEIKVIEFSYIPERIFWKYLFWKKNHQMTRKHRKLNTSFMGRIRALVQAGLEKSSKPIPSKPQPKKSSSYPISVKKSNFPGIHAAPSAHFCFLMTLTYLMHILYYNLILWCEGSWKWLEMYMYSILLSSANLTLLSLELIPGIIIISCKQNTCLNLTR